jgi:very-short-patch-repair endonuclease
MKQLAFARQLRHEQTDCETRLWQHLRAHRLFGLKFRRQQPVGDYVVDFFCSEHRLVVELDGGQHRERAAFDLERDAWLRSHGYAVLRYWNNDVMGNLDGVLEDIARRAGVLGAGKVAVAAGDEVTPPSPQPLCGPEAHPSLRSGPQLCCVLRPSVWSPQGRGALTPLPPGGGGGGGEGGSQQP